MRTIVILILVGVVLGAGLLALTGCESPEAQRLRAQASLANAEAARERARGEADAQRIQAESEADVARQQARTEAEANLAATRQMERDAAHQRWLETLTAMALVLLPLSLVATVVLLVLMRRPAPAAADPQLLVLLQRLALEQAGREREVWRAVAQLSRRSLPADGVDREGVVWEPGQSWPPE